MIDGGRWGEFKDFFTNLWSGNGMELGGELVSR